MHTHPVGPAVPAATRRRVALLVAALAALLAGAPAGAQPGDAAALPGLIVEASDLPLDAFGQPALDGIAGARAAPPLPEAVGQRLRELTEQRAAIGLVSPAGAAPVLLGPLPGERDAPARRDAGERDPDRLRSAPPRPFQP
jgi:hypothetical protein